jgi:hypothetical protein
LKAPLGRIVASWALVGLALLPGRTHGQEPEVDYGAGSARLVEVLALVAARDGAEAARQLTGPELPGYLDRVLGDLQDAPEAADVRGFAGRLRLQASLVPRLLAAKGVHAASDRFTRDASGRLEGALGKLEQGIRRLGGAAAELSSAAAKGGVPSRRVVPDHPAGQEVLLMAAGAPLWRARLAEARDATSTYVLLADLLDHEQDLLVGFALTLMRRTAALAPAELGMLDREGAVASALAHLEARLLEAASELRDAVEASVQAVTAIRDEELARVVAGGRSPQLQQTLRLFAAYKGQFRAPPDLEATPYLDVYAQRGTGQLFFWAEAEGSWIAGGEPAQPLEPVIEALTSSRSPTLHAQLGNARALGLIYTLFHTAAEASPFQEGLERYLAVVRDTAQRWAAASDVLSGVRHARLESTPVGPGLELGFSPFTGPEGVAVARDELLVAALEGGPGQAHALIEAATRTAERWASLRLLAVRIVLELPAEARADLCWTPPRTDPRWLVAPPSQAGASEVAGVLRLREGEAPPAIHVEARAHHADAYLLAQAPPVAAPHPAPPTREPAKGPRLALSAGGRRVEQLPHEARLLHVWLETPAGTRLLRPAPHGAWLDLDPRDPALKGRLLGRDAQGRLRAAPVTVELPQRAAVVLGDGDANVWHVEPGQPLRAQVWARGTPLGEAWVYQVRDAHGALVHQEETESLTWPARAPPGRYQVAAPGAEPTWFAIADAPPRVVAAASPWREPLTSVAPGQACLLRLEAWPWLTADEVSHVEWAWGGGSEERVATTYALPGHSETALQLPITLGADAAPGRRTVSARAYTPRGSLLVEGQVEVAPGRTVAVELLDASLRRQTSLVRGGLALLRAGAELHHAEGTLIDPAGRAQRLPPRADGLVPLSLSPEALWGPYQVWVWGRAQAEGTAVHGRLQIPVKRGRPESELGLPLTQVAVQVQGVQARGGSLIPVRVHARGLELGVAEAPGPLGSLALRSQVAPLVGASPARLRLFLVGEPHDAPPGVALPGVWETMSPRAQLCLEASLQLELDGQLIQLGTTRRVEAGGVDLTLDVEIDAERALVRALHGQRLEAELGRPLRRARRLELVVRARLRPALPPSVWPPKHDRPAPLEIDGVRWSLDPDLLPQTSVELRVRWDRAETPAEQVLGDLSAAEPRPLDAAAEVRAAETALAADRPAAAALHARRATLASDDPRAWTALAEIALQRRRPAEALSLAQRALETSDFARAWIVVGEAALGRGQVETARQAADAATTSLPAGSPLEARLQRLQRKLR